MNTNNDEPGFNSHDCIDVIVDGPWDTTVRPCRPELLAYAQAQKEKFEHWQKHEECDPQTDIQ